MRKIPKRNNFENTGILTKTILEKYMHLERKEIAKILNINYVSIKRYIRKFGLKPREKRHEKSICGRNIYIFNKEKGRKVLEHRYIIEKHLNKKLSKNAVVHHIDGESHNNNLNNLLVMSKINHDRYHIIRKNQSKDFKNDNIESILKALCKSLNKKYNNKMKMYAELYRIIKI
ncbi:MAG: hypothetical protein WC934_14925 [Acidithiobacillus sp.]|jgi:hypothetical protein|uniref:hypothetical protein n=1 Tax=Acidithiobacillus sp. TaxID=1872118 RepID=UPI00355E5131